MQIYIYIYKKKRKLFQEYICNTKILQVRLRVWVSILSYAYKIVSAPLVHTIFFFLLPLTLLFFPLHAYWVCFVELYILYIHSRTRWFQITWTERVFNFTWRFFFFFWLYLSALIRQTNTFVSTHTPFFLFLCIYILIFYFFNVFVTL